MSGCDLILHSVKNEKERATLPFMESLKNYFVNFWKGLWSLLVGMKVTGTEFVTPKVTEQYPENRETLKSVSEQPLRLNSMPKVIINVSRAVSVR